MLNLDLSGSVRKEKKQKTSEEVCGRMDKQKHGTCTEQSRLKIGIHYVKA